MHDSVTDKYPFNGTFYSLQSRLPKNFFVNIVCSSSSTYYNTCTFHLALDSKIRDPALVDPGDVLKFFEVSQ